ncbi:hypothetical protein JKP88DRAFT_93624 [Tribonema minus]|uniref:Uncharacterized protein n=1 Tax=Tribonema minus TaxID=303371 RepID=A0A835YJJ1_9STRA|nr:hypothetical protein JKP88DRAFT_93624 [Tribonema minus]
MLRECAGQLPPAARALLHHAARDQDLSLTAAAAAPRAIVPGASLSVGAQPVTRAGGLGAGGNPLDAYFPFDPYLLRRSHAYVAGMYNYWHGGGGGGDDSDSGSDDDVSDGGSSVYSEDVDGEAEPQACSPTPASVDEVDMAVSAKFASSFISDRMSVGGGTPASASPLRVHGDAFHEMVATTPGETFTMKRERRASIADDGW